MITPSAIVILPFFPRANVCTQRTPCRGKGQGVRWLAGCLALVHLHHPLSQGISATYCEGGLSSTAGFDPTQLFEGPWNPYLNG